MEGIEIVWVAPEFKISEKKPLWYWISIVIAIFLLGAAVWQQNFLFGIFIVIGEILIIIWGNKEPRAIEFRLTEHHLTIFGNLHYHLSDIEHFSIDENENEWANVSVRFHRALRPNLKFMTPQEHTSAIRERFGQYAPHVPWEDSFIDSLEKFLGF